MRAGIAAMERTAGVFDSSMAAPAATPAAGADGVPFAAGMAAAPMAAVAAEAVGEPPAKAAALSLGPVGSVWRVAAEHRRAMQPVRPPFAGRPE